MTPRMTDTMATPRMNLKDKAAEAPAVSRWVPVEVEAGGVDELSAFFLLFLLDGVETGDPMSPMSRDLISP